MLFQDERIAGMAMAPIFARRDEGEALWFFGMLVLSRVSADASGGQFSLTEQYAPRGIATPFHRQLDDPETFHILDGELTFYLSDQKPIVAGAGDTVFVPAGEAHAFVVTSETARFLNLTTPNHEAFFRSVGEPAVARELPPPGEPDMPRVMAAAGQYGVEILGPPPGAGHDAH
jgi:quercetin dioxygenase-like cupin family protein